MEEDKKNIDESWKQAVEKETSKTQETKGFVPPEANFNFFITTLSLQATIALGEVANPATNKKEQDLSQAKFLIDILNMLKEKTKGNLSSEESTLLENLLYELRMQFINKSKSLASDK
ncbi:MAG: DUF1844 domain-containing protein [Candidatus Omnitrophica bacterium]|nr:DUF1844 domain-containing protein [Candidatus Omnitrophota bacterium]